MTGVSPFAVTTQVSGGTSDLGVAAIGPHMARLNGVVDVGIHPQSYEGKAKPDAQEIVFIFELLDDTVTIDGHVQNRIFSKNVVLPVPGKGMSEKSHLYALFTALNAADVNGDFSQCLTRPVNLTLVEKDSGKPGFGGIAAYPAGVQLPPATLPTFTFTPKSPDMRVWETLPNWLKDKITSALDYSTTPLAAQAAQAPQQQAAQQAVQQQVVQQPAQQQVAHQQYAQQTQQPVQQMAPQGQVQQNIQQPAQQQFAQPNQAYAQPLQGTEVPQQVAPQGQVINQAPQQAQAGQSPLQQNIPAAPPVPGA